MVGKVIKEMDGKMLFFIMEVIFVEEDGYKIVLEYLNFDFDIDVKESFFFV